jgi:hypothetical protein
MAWKGCFIPGVEKGKASMREGSARRRCILGGFAPTSLEDSPSFVGAKPPGWDLCQTKPWYHRCFALLKKPINPFQKGEASVKGGFYSPGSGPMASPLQEMEPYL